MGRAIVNRNPNEVAIPKTAEVGGRALVNKIKSVNVKRKEQVIPFDNEHLFTVPKVGGFGQPDNENFVMVTGNNIGNVPSPTDTTQTGEGVGTTTGTPSTTITPRTTATPPIETAPTQPINTTPTPRVFTPIADVIPCTSFTYGSWSACNNGLRTRTYVGIPSGCTTTPSLTDTQERCTMSVDLPTFPDFSTLDCTSLKDWVAKINSLLATSRFTPDIATAYNNALASANASYTTKCYVNPSAVVVIPDAPIGGGGFGGGGGSADEGLPQVEEKKNNNGLFLILGVIGVLYFLTRKKD